MLIICIIKFSQLVKTLYTITWLLCAFWLVLLKGYTHRWRQIHVRSRNKPFFLLYKTNRLHFPTWLRLVSFFLFFIRCDVICGLLQYTRTENCNLFFKYERNLYITQKLGWKSSLGEALDQLRVRVIMSHVF